MKHRIIAAGILLVFLIAGYTYFINRETIYIDQTLTGESVHWKLEMAAKGSAYFKTKKDVLHVESDGDYQLTLTYKGTLDEIQTMRSIKIDQRQPMFTSLQETSDSAPTSLTFQYKNHLSASAINAIKEGETLTITVTWDGENGDTETIELQ
ncbi:hypothetical protein KHM83_01355 [Fusibacter paucivorans]|uniref:Uncharacterized protein n=1 Tax=Fusibacter paucivorans TaxID=76009 RepID=A0ABS5PMN9_9FIRM|nr:hypothetical protein [Fusibacter paucivorans]MBS7525317.1 hypothetical protein [Fusibacter paucivorans]